MTRTRTAALVAVTVLTVAAFGFAVLATAFVACGISGCSGGGFGPSFDPVGAQVGLAVCGAVWLPLALLVLRGRPVRDRMLGGLGLVVAAAVLAVALTGVGPSGCPLGQSRATTGPDAFDPGAPTCSADRDAQ